MCINRKNKMYTDIPLSNNQQLFHVKFCVILIFTIFSWQYFPQAQ